MAYAVVRTDLMYATDVRSGLVSIKYLGADGETETEIENGNVLKVGELIGREVYAGSAVAANDQLKDVVLIASPEVIYDERKKNLSDYINVAGKICRGYHLHNADVFSVTKDALTGVSAPVKGDIVELAAGTKLNVVAKASGATVGSTVVGIIDDVEKAGRYTYYAVKVSM